jgi:hypothetical protein
MAVPPDTAERVLLAGGGLTTEPMTPDTLVRLAKAAAAGGSHLTVR